MNTNIKKVSFLAVVLLVAIGLMALTAAAQRGVPSAQVAVPPAPGPVPPGGGTVPPSQGGVPPGQPFQALQAQIDALKAEVGVLQAQVQANLIANHFQEITFSLAPGASFSFPLPKKNVPVRIEVTFTLENGGTQKPSEVMYAVMNQDLVSNDMTWVGTNNDASSKADNTLTSTDMVIANIFGETAPAVIASLMVEDPATSTLKVFQNTGTTTGNYVVHFWF